MQASFNVSIDSKATSSIRQFSVGIDQPAYVSGSAQGPNADELALVALGTCQEITYKAYANALGIPVRSISASVKGLIDTRGFAATSNSPSSGVSVRPGFTDVSVDITIDSPADGEILTKLRDAVDVHCPVLDIFTNKVPVTFAVNRVSVSN